jgi:hypothetical protein
MLFDWPTWAVGSFTILLAVCTYMHWSLKQGMDPKVVTQAADPAFVTFQRNYLTVYYLVMLADWLQVKECTCRNIPLHRLIEAFGHIVHAGDAYVHAVQ